jgi:serine/threonine protein kinase, bacterial
MPLRIGETFAGYRIVRLLGSGGMGEVYLVEHPRLPRHDALKVLRPDVSGDTSFRSGLSAKPTWPLGCATPTLCGIHDRGEHDGQLWIAMDYIEGTDTAHLMEQRYPAGMPFDRVLPIIAAIASALDYAHQKGLLHRDVKPANIIVADTDTDDPSIFLADFGIARPLDDTNGLTTTNMTVGTVAYAAPEQLMGEPMDGRSDQYALAATTYNLLTGLRLFPHSNPAVVISRHLNTTPPKLGDYRSDLAGLDAILQVGLAKNPGDRYPSCTAFTSALARDNPGHAVSPDASTLAARPPRKAALEASPALAAGQSHLKSAGAGSRRTWIPLASAAAIVLLVGVIALAWRPWETHKSISVSTSAQPTPAPTPTLTLTPSVPALSSPGQNGPTASPATSTAEPAKVCVTGEDSAAVQSVVRRFTPQDIFPQASDDLTVATEGGNFDSCATLSAVFISIAEGTGSTPSQVLLFHKGSYVGPATPKPHSFTSLDTALTTDDTVVLKYGVPGSCNACPDMTFTIVQFRWQVDHVEMTGAPPYTWAGN